MSVHRENITWQSPDGTWNRGFYDFDQWGEDHEWDVDYDFDRFWWVSTGHATEERANASWNGANPGGGSSIAADVSDPETQEELLALEDLAAQAFADPDAQSYGPKKERVPKLLARQLSSARVEAHRHKVQGYANLPDPRIPDLEKQLDARMRTATPKERAEVRKEFQAAANKLEKILGDTRNMMRSGNKPADREAATAAIDSWRRYRGPNASTPAPASTGSARAKTSAKSTPGSFAPRGRSTPDIRLG